MDNRVPTKNVGRKPLSVLYSSDSNRLLPAQIGKCNVNEGAKATSPTKATFIFCDDQDENAGANIGQCNNERNKASVRPCEGDHSEASEETENKKTLYGERDRIFDRANQNPSACLSSIISGEDRVRKNDINVDLENIAEITTCGVSKYAEEDEYGGHDVDQEMAENKSSSVLCVSMKSATFSCDWTSTPSEKETRRDVIISCPDYAVDVHSYLQELEKNFRPKPYYMRKQPQISIEMRSILVDWLVDVANEYDLSQETLHLAVGYTDRFLSIMAVRKEHLQLLGVAALMIAAKYEEIYPPVLHDFVYITDDTYSKREMIQMEQIILKTLNFGLSSPTAFIFLISYLKHSHAGQRCQSLAKYLCDLSLMEYSFLSYLPSLIAASCAFLAHYVTSGICQAVAVPNVTAYTMAEIYPCAQALLALFKISADQSQQAIREKYKDDKYCRVSLLEPPDSLPPPDAL